MRLKSPCDCWAADLGITDSTNPNEVQVQFQLTLGGLGSVGRSPFGRDPFQTRGLVGSPTVSAAELLKPRAARRV